MKQKDQGPSSSTAVAEQLEQHAARTRMGYAERFEHDAEAFYRDTGLLAPGKSVPMEMWSSDYDERREAAWQARNEKAKADFINLMTEAASLLRALGRGQEGHHYGRPLQVAVERGELVIRIGIDVLAHAVTYSDWANPFNEQVNDYVREFAITDAEQFAKDVQHAMLDEREDGSTPLSDFIDKASEAAIGDGSLAICEDDHAIKHGETAKCEASWAHRRGD